MKKFIIMVMSMCLLTSCVQTVSKNHDVLQQESNVMNETEETTDKKQIIKGETQTDNKARRLLQEYVNNEHAPKEIPIIDVNQFIEVGNYRFIVCNALVDKLSSYIVVKIETIDGSKLPCGDLSQAPIEHSKILTDIYFDYQVYYYEVGQCVTYSSTLRCDSLEQQNEGYYLLSSDLFMSIGTFRKLDDMHLVIDRIALEEPYYGIVGEVTEILLDEKIIFEIPITVDAYEEKLVTSDGMEGYLSQFGFYTQLNEELNNGLNTALNFATFTVTFKDQTTLESSTLDLASGCSTLDDKGVLNLNWYGYYLDVNEIESITIYINGMELIWKR